MKKSKFLLIDAAVLPDVFARVLDAKQFLSAGKAGTAAEAARMAGISRSAFYKYKDAVYTYNSETTASKIISIHAVLQDKPGVLMAVISAFYNVGANILTINQNIPISGLAPVSVSANIEQMKIGLDELVQRLQNIPGVNTIENISGN